jgi:threonine dehydratase
VSAVQAGNIEPGAVTPGLIERYVHDLVTVSEAEIRHRLRYLAAERGYATEGAGAVAVAAVLTGKVSPHGRTVVIVSGPNVALPTLADVFAPL